METTLEFLFRFDRQSGEAVPSHRHQCYELVYYNGGRGSTVIGTEEWTFAKGDYALIHPSTPHSETRTALTDVMCVGFVLEGRNTQHHPFPEGVFQDDQEDGLVPLLERMLAELQEQQPRYGSMLDLLAAELAIRLERRFLPDSLHEAENEFRYTLNYINEHFNQQIDFRSLSSMAGYSYDRYRHLFKQQTGLSPVQFIIARRMAYARSLLRHTSLSISYVAMESGFSNDAQFCSMFKREHGITPKQYRVQSLT